MCGREEKENSPLSSQIKKRASTSERSTARTRSRQRRERGKKAFDDFDGEEAKTLTTTRKERNILEMKEKKANLLVGGR